MLNTVGGHDAGALSELDLRAISYIKAGGNWRDLPSDFPSLRVRQIRESAAAGAGSRSSYYGRLEWDRPAATIATYFMRPGNGANIHPRAPRTLTFREASRLQGFQDHVEFVGSRRARAIQIGNAVPPVVGAWLASALPIRGPAVDLFCGAGGLTAGIHAAGFSTVAAADNDADALRTLASHVQLSIPPLPTDLSNEAQRAEFIRAVTTELGGDRLSLVAGGPPCQGFSTAGNNRLSEDPRNDLPEAFFLCVAAFRPAQVLFENVAALTWTSRRPWFDRLLRRLQGEGYNVSWRVVHCEAAGLPQRRRRVVVVGTLTSLPRFEFPAGPCKVLEPRYRDVAQPENPTASEPPTVRDAIGDLPDEPTISAATRVGLVADGVDSLFRRYVRGNVSLADYAAAAMTSPGRER